MERAGVKRFAWLLWWRGMGIALKNKDVVNVEGLLCNATFSGDALRSNVVVRHKIGIAEYLHNLPKMFSGEYLSWCQQCDMCYVQEVQIPLLAGSTAKPMLDWRHMPRIFTGHDKGTSFGKKKEKTTPTTQADWESILSQPIFMFLSVTSIVLWLQRKQSGAANFVWARGWGRWSD